MFLSLLTGDKISIVDFIGEIMGNFMSLYQPLSKYPALCREGRSVCQQLGGDLVSTRTDQDWTDLHRIMIDNNIARCWIREAVTVEN